jgi:hypothetical protein
MARGSLVIVGVGYSAGGHTTIEAQAEIVAAGKVFYLFGDRLAETSLAHLNPTAESLRDSYQPGRLGLDSAEEMIERILCEVRAGRDVCVAVSGHPAVLEYVAHGALGRAQKEGYEARMLPGISVLDCLYADLGLDPAANGCQVFDATDFLIRGRRFDPACPLILLQVGVIGVRRYATRNARGAAGLRVLGEVLRKMYPSGHRGVLYETSVYAVCAPRVRRVALARLATARVQVNMTLYVPPGTATKVDAKVLARLRHEIPKEKSGG